MKNRSGKRPVKYPHRITIRFSEKEVALLEQQTLTTGLSLSEYVRRRLFGGRPIMSHTDANTIRELRRIGGLLKHNFETLRTAHAPYDVISQQEHALRMLVIAINEIGVQHDS